MFAQRLDKIAPFRVMEVLARAGELEAAGHEVVHLEVGEPDFSTAAPIVEAGRVALADGKTKYTAATGIIPLREKIAAHYAELGVEVCPERIIITSGASGGLTLLSALLLNPGDEILITDPGYPCNEVFAQLVGGVPRPMIVTANNGFQPKVTDIRDAWTARTKGVLLASPANPTGTMLHSSDLQEIAGYVANQDGFFVLDEIYQGLVRGEVYRTGLSISQELFILNSFSKYFGMTGWRLGWIVVPEQAIEYVTRLAQNLFICPSTPAQYAALSAFDLDSMQIHEERAREFDARCERLYEGLLALGFQIPVRPNGAFYLYVDVSHTGLTSTEFCQRLLDEYFVAVTPGEDFGANENDRYVRFAYTTSMASIDLALDRLAQALQAW
ncbi:MAG: aminotransferase class I/II-fold pyridoxal phosphate-dependent enzyme [Pseudomonadales bacterium]|nr:aminotransferase class I/II-fold pyridoxal phosphate-dependent enzyme [Pseudomonadales bacterium]